MDINLDSFNKRCSSIHKVQVIIFSDTVRKDYKVKHTFKLNN